MDLIVRNLPDHVERQIGRRALSNGRSLQDEVRAILRAAVEEPTAKTPATGLGSQIAALFRHQPDLGDEDFEVPSVN